MSDPSGPEREGAASAEDAMQRAVELNDGIVQLLAVARYSLDSGDSAQAREAIDGSLEHARDLMNALLATSGMLLRPGDLRTRGPAPERSDENRPKGESD
jgi:uncharacterized protein HemY